MFGKFSSDDALFQSSSLTEERVTRGRQILNKKCWLFWVKGKSVSGRGMGYNRTRGPRFEAGASWLEGPHAHQPSTRPVLKCWLCLCIWVKLAAMLALLMPTSKVTLRLCRKLVKCACRCSEVCNFANLACAACLQ